MVAGGGASVIYRYFKILNWSKQRKFNLLAQLICSDTICDLGGASELANYGEYSGAPSEQQTYEYAKTILSLMIKEKHECGKVLIIGGGIANFTNVAATFRVILNKKNLKSYKNYLLNKIKNKGNCKSIARI